MDELYVQCDLVRGPSRQTSWLPARFAVPGKVLRLREGESWENGWLVTAVWSARSYDWVRSLDADRRHVSKALSTSR